MCIDCNDAGCCWGLFFWGFVFAVVVFAVVVIAVVVVETWHAASLPDGTGDGTGRNRGWNRTEPGRNRDGTGTGAGTVWGAAEEGAVGGGETVETDASTTDSAVDILGFPIK